MQPGVVLDQLNAAAAEHGLTFGPDVATASRATLGGMIANDACGARSIRYGKTIDHVETLTVVLADGSVAALGPLNAEALATQCTGDTIAARAHAAVSVAAEELRDEIRER